ncbi:hypothetical protein CEUSTIGMA_g7239.t1 [Chlamydomonas eustigma]|uniref:Nucleotide-diphospho-sugar transferase domain-containing protein n=1 Tax=Chlamydomonas eustigma TaxID=1157962 RepID=A0A250XA78_9CHLO|nr:hypothetical protein CEUSTIGMA_g7239.t1 [Chlamydomonas eustigma]|eukprot:GAX79799.1 hypothetical protein CEUSTIGMA_g7239.t1 [Chlamydomonas eustigma]
MQSALLFTVVVYCIIFRANSAVLHHTDLQNSSKHFLHPHLRCQQLHLCSSGHVKPFLGDIFDGPVLENALQARSFNKELILIANSLYKLGGLIQLLSNLETLGYAHVLLLSYNREECEGLLALFPGIGCAWTRFAFDEESGVEERFLLWFLRYKTMIRAVRLGYNVLMTDNDVVFFEDPYSFFKRPPFSHFVVLNQQEWPDSHIANGGFIYIQNARPDGPAVWLFVEATDRLLRHADNRWSWIKSLGLESPCNAMDQTMLNEVLPSVVTGRPVWRDAWKDCQPDEKDPKLLSRHEAVQKFINWDDKQTKVSAWPTPHEWLYFVGEDSFQLRYLNMTYPNNQGVWPSELGGPLYPPDRARLSTQFHEQLRLDCPSCPVLLDHEDGSLAAAAAAVPSEGYLFLPPWLITSWWYKGRLGMWDAHLCHGPKPRSPLGHVHWVQNACEFHANSVKAIPLMASWHYNWTAAHAVQGDHVYLASQDTHGKPLETPVPHIIALAPAVQASLAHLPDYAAMQLMMQHLAKLAILSGRVPVWPTVDCSASYAANKTQHDWLPAPFKDGALPTTDWIVYFDHNWKNHMCHRMQLDEPECLFEGRGMTVWELEHYKMHHILKSGLEAEGTALSVSDVHPKAGLNAVAVGPYIHLWRNQSSPVGERRPLGEIVREILVQHEAQPVLWLLDLPDIHIPPSLPELQEQYEDLIQGCRALHCSGCGDNDDQCSWPLPE